MGRVFLYPGSQGEWKKDKNMSDKIFNKLITLSVDELDNYIEFLESIYSPTITGKEIDKKTMEYLGITD